MLFDTSLQLQSLTPKLVPFLFICQSHTQASTLDTLTVGLVRYVTHIIIAYSGRASDVHALRNVYFPPSWLANNNNQFKIKEN